MVPKRFELLGCDFNHFVFVKGIFARPTFIFEIEQLMDNLCRQLTVKLTDLPD